MAATIEETNVTYEQLAELEREFEDAENEILRQQVALTKPLYEKRQKTLAEIPHFWPLVLEQAPQDIDEYIQPVDSEVLSTSLKSISVSRFEIEDGGSGDPRSIAIKFEFKENDYFEDTVLEKKFWYRRSRTDWAGLVSEPVPIKWKADRDLTGGLLDMVIAVWNQQKKHDQASANGGELADAKKALRSKIETTGLGGVSFFAWFGFRGFPISAEENRIAVEKEKEKRRLVAEGKSVEADDDDDDEAPQLVKEGEDEDDDEEARLEIFPDGDQLAITFSEDLWPNAIKYFTQAQEQDALSDMDFEDGEHETDDSQEDEPPSKKRKA